MEVCTSTDCPPGHASLRFASLRFARFLYEADAMQMPMWQENLSALAC